MPIIHALTCARVLETLFSAPVGVQSGFLSFTNNKEVSSGKDSKKITFPGQFDSMVYNWAVMMVFDRDCIINHFIWSEHNWFLSFFSSIHYWLLTIDYQCPPVQRCNFSFNNSQCLGFISFVLNQDRIIINWLLLHHTNDSNRFTHARPLKVSCKWSQCLKFNVNNDSSAPSPPQKF